MSENDNQLLNSIGLNRKVFAEALEVSPQALSTGISRSNSSRSYLTLERLIKIYKFLERHDTYSCYALNFRKKAEQIYGYESLLDDKSDINVFNYHPIERPDLSEIWVISNQPFELNDNNYIEEMFETVFNKKNSKVVYFLSQSDIANNLSSIFQKRIDDMLRSSLKYDVPDITVIWSASLFFTPHISIFNPLSETPELLVHIETGRGESTGFAKIPDETAKLIIMHIRTVLHVSKGHLVIKENSYSNYEKTITFNVVYQSKKKDYVK